MRYLLISLLDRAVNAFQPPAVVRAEGEALRVFKDLINNPQSTQHTHPDDFDLYVVGEFDDQTGQLQPIDAPKKIADGKSFNEMIQAK